MASGYYYYFLFEEEGWNSSVNDDSIEDAENNYDADNIDGTEVDSWHGKQWFFLL